MNLKVFIGFLLCVSLLLQPVVITAFETDQYNLPKIPLTDIGDEVTAYTFRNVKEAVGKVNGKIQTLAACTKNKKSANHTNKKCRLSRKTLKKLKFLRSDDAIAKAVFKELGAGFLPFTKSSSWMEGHKFAAQHSRYKTSFRKSIYITAPVNYVTLSSTVRLYGTEFGTDKIAHIFQQGYDYHKIYKQGLAKGLTKKQAVKKAVKWGQKTENTYFGIWVSGVYSNADLYSNYAGFKFYLGLTEEIRVGNDIRPSTLIIEKGTWKFNKAKDLSENLLKPFISKHLNEAYNPNKYFNILGFRKVIKRVVKKRSCKQWFKRYPNLSKSHLEATTRSLQLWYGEDYGFSSSKKFITIANTCFSK